MGKNILFVLHRYPGFGGIEIVTTYLADYLVENNCNVVIYSYTNQNKDVLIGDLNSRVEFYESADGVLMSEKNREHLCNIIRKKQIDVMVWQDSYYPLDTIIQKVKKETSVDLWIVEHNTPNCQLLALKAWHPETLYYRIKKKLFYPLYYAKKFHEIRERHKVLYKLCDKYILLSEKFYPVWEKVSGIKDHSKLTFVNNPITIECQNWQKEEKRNYCLFCGRLNKQKGIDKLMRIWKEIERQGTEWDLLIVGDGEEKNYVQDFINSNNLKHVQMEGFQHDVISYYRKSKILCMTSVYEGWPLTLNESMSYGCVPILFESYAAASDIIKNKTNGYLVKPFIISDYVNTLLGLMNDEIMLETMQSQAQKDSERFTIENIGRKWISLLKES